ncbi:MAG: hypothetical protein EOO04_05485 [Chitinophagaceae bacterium]|nr:MAG: hypothetical protein EOO04_05485 [Chitinophagaceae bacterium]
MKASITHIGKLSLRICLCACVVLFIAGCNKKKLNENLTFWKNDKIPYGTFYAYNQLSSLFPEATVTVNKNSPDLYNTESNSSFEVRTQFDDTSGKSLFMVITPSVEPDKRELQAMLNYISQGNHIFISAVDISRNLLDSLRLSVKSGPAYLRLGDSLAVSLIHPQDDDTMSYAYPGAQLDSYLDKYDSAITEILGYNSDGKPNFVRFTYEGGGSLYLHFAPTVFTNFFLLHKENKTYYDFALSYLPAEITSVAWDEYFRYHRDGRSEENNDFSALSWMMKQPALAWMMWILLGLFLIVYLFESKRRQRAIPLRSKLKNTSVDFVKTIGRLYFHRKDNKNLAAKMTTHFLDQVRSHYNIPTSRLDAGFEKRFAYKSGFPEQEVSGLLSQIRMIRERPLIEDDLLMSYHNTLNKFINAMKHGR